MLEDSFMKHLDAAGTGRHFLLILTSNDNAYLGDLWRGANGENGTGSTINAYQVLFDETSGRPCTSFW